MPLDPALREKTRRIIWEAFGYQTSESAVDRFHASDARTKIISCPARTSKSYAGWKDVLPDILMHGAELQLNPELETQICWIVAPNYDLAKEFDYAWEDLIERRKQVGFGDYKVEAARNNPKQGDMQIVIAWGKNAKGQEVKSIIEVKSATNIKSLQSEQVHIAILSEAARLPSIVWTKYMSTRTGRSVWPTTPDIEAAWIFDMIERGRKNPELNIAPFEFTGRANPRYDWELFWLEHAKTEEEEEGAILTRPRDNLASPSAENGHDCFDPTVECVAMKQDGFGEQFGGKWVFHKGRVVPLRTTMGENGQPSHVIHEDREWFKHADLHVAMDYGFADGTCIGFWLVGPHQVVLRKSIYRTGMVPDDVYREYKLMLDWFDDTYAGGMRKMIRRTVGDPKKPEVAEVFRRRGIPVFDIDKRAQADRKAGHLELMNALKTDPATGEPRMLVHADNAEVIKEWSRLRRNEKVNEDAPTAFKGADHAYDQARYFLMTRPLGREVPFYQRTTPFEQLRQNVLKKQRKERRVTVNRQTGVNRHGGLIAS